MARARKLYLDEVDLQKRGWSKTDIKDLLKEPDKYSPKEREPLYLRIRVERAEKKRQVN